MKAKRKHPKIKISENYRGDKTITYHLSNGKLHRIDGPAKIKTNKDGEEIYHEWWRNGKLHRIDGPAKYNLNDNKWVNYYYNGKSLSKQDYDYIVRSGKLNGLLN